MLFLLLKWAAWFPWRIHVSECHSPDAQVTSDPGNILHEAWLSPDSLTSLNILQPIKNLLKRFITLLTKCFHFFIFNKHFMGKLFQAWMFISNQKFPTKIFSSTIFYLHIFLIQLSQINLKGLLLFLFLSPEPAA